MRSIYKSAAGERAVRERYLKILDYWPVPHEQLRIPTREGETFVIACGPVGAPALVLLHGASANAASWTADVRTWAEHFRVFAVDVIGDAGLSAPSRPSVKTDRYAWWLHDVMEGLAIQNASLVGVSNGAWLALDFAVRWPERIAHLALFCPAGIVRSRNLLWKVFPYLLLGKWGAARIREMFLGRIPKDASPAHKYFAEFAALVFEHLRPRTERHPIFRDDQLQRLTMPLLVILGGRDIVFDSTALKQRIERLLPHAAVRFLADAGHFIPGQTLAVRDFLQDSTLVAANHH